MAVSKPVGFMVQQRAASYVAISKLTNQGAEAAIAAGKAEAQKLGFNVTVAVVDAGGILVATSRMDGAMPVSADIALGKAKSAVLFARETKLLEGGSNVKDGAARTALLSAGHVLMEGGIPIVKDGAIVGGVGVSGVLPQQDQQVCTAAVAALA
jgi:glc operon protein GlcG